MIKKIKPWRLNYVVSYADSAAVREYQDLVLAILKNIALLRYIDCAITTEYPFYDAEFLSEHPTLQGSSSDLVYFRSSPHSPISRKEFRNILDQIFDMEQDQADGRLDVGAQLLSALPQYPFPESQDNNPTPQKPHLLVLRPSKVPS